MTKVDKFFKPAAVLSKFRLSDKEWIDLDKKYGKLCKFQARTLLDKNTTSMHTEDYEDIEQEMRQSMIVAALYAKRHKYIEDCFEIGNKIIKDDKNLFTLNKLESIWRNKATRFTRVHDQMLEDLMINCVPENYRPSPNTPLDVDSSKFKAYCKGITWNRCKAMGRKITKERPLRSGIVSLSKFDFSGQDLEI